MKTDRTTSVTIGGLVTTPTITTNRPMINSVRLATEAQVGGWSRRCGLAAPFVFFSVVVGGRPVRPRASTTPAALPRCLLRRRRFVWDMTPGRLDAQGGPLGGRPRGGAPPRPRRRAARLPVVGGPCLRRVGPL